jgi:hypothetical protein
VDFNNDSLPDLISGDRSGYVNYFRRLPGGGLTTEPKIQVNGSTILYQYNSAPNIVDWNEDGRLDMLLANSDASPRRIRLYLNSGTPESYLFTTYTELTAGGSPIDQSRCNPNVVDLNRDGRKDLVVGEDNGRIFYYENTGTNAVPVLAAGVMLEAEGVPIQFPSGYTDLKVWVDDWNEDGTPDLVVGNYEDSVHLFIAYPPTAVEEQPGRTPGYADRPTVISRAHLLARMQQDPDLILLDATGRTITDPARISPGIYFIRGASSGSKVLIPR